MNESRAARHQRCRRRARAAGVLSGGALLAVLAFTPAGRALAAWAESLTSTLPSPIASAAALTLFVSLLVVAWELAALPALLLTGPGGPRRPRGQEEVVSARDMAVGAAVALPAAVIVAAVIQAATWLGGSWWWLMAAAFVAGVLVVVMHAGPGVLARLSGARPLTRPALVERLGALSRQIRVPIQSIDELPPGATATATALVAGGGSERRVFIAAELAQDWSDDEVAFVVAHEFAHHAHHDLWLTLVLDAAVLATGFWAADWLASGGFPAVSPWLAPIGDLAALPFVALTVAVAWVLSAPLRNAVSRHQERRADAFALRTTGSADAFRTALRRLALRHLAEERPSRMTQWLYHRHPSVAERLETADAFQGRARNPSIDQSI
jgi:Zn-dependent protease with chaperone function